MWGYYLQVPEGALASVLVDDQERQQSRYRSGRCIRRSKRAWSPALRACFPRRYSSWCNRAATPRSRPFTPLPPAATRAIASAWSAMLVRCFPRSRVVASSGRWPVPPH
jgi:hypothetical protein